MRHDQRRGAHGVLTYLRWYQLALVIGAGPARSCREIIEASVAQFSNVQKV
jgi:hypothetical protein